MLFASEPGSVQGLRTCRTGVRPATRSASRIPGTSAGPLACSWLSPEPAEQQVPVPAQVHVDMKVGASLAMTFDAAPEGCKGPLLRAPGCKLHDVAGGDSGLGVSGMHSAPCCVHMAASCTRQHEGSGLWVQGSELQRLCCAAASCTVWQVALYMEHLRTHRMLRANQECMRSAAPMLPMAVDGPIAAGCTAGAACGARSEGSPGQLRHLAQSRLTCVQCTGLPGGLAPALFPAPHLGPSFLKPAIACQSGQ